MSECTSLKAVSYVKIMRWLSVAVLPFENVAGLAVEGLAKRIQRGKANGFGTSVLQNGHIGGVMPICSASSPTPILRLAIMTSRLMRIVISDHLLELAGLVGGGAQQAFHHNHQQHESDFGETATPSTRAMV